MSEIKEKKAPVRVSLPIAVIIGILGSMITFAATWGATSERIKNLEGTVSELKSQNDELRKIVISNDRQIAELKIFTTDAIRRLDRIERKIDETQGTTLRGPSR